MSFVFWKRLVPEASEPKRNNPDDAGADLRSAESLLIQPASRALVKTGLSIALPQGFYGRIAPRSGIALKHGIDVFAGVIDSSYRGEICVLLYNSDQKDPFSINVGDRIAQLIIEKHYNLLFVEKKELDETDRGNNGFGSSGII